MPASLRHLLAVIVGVVVAFGLVAGIEMLGHRVYPPPAGIDFTNADAIKAYMAAVPAGALLFVLAAWVIAAFAGTLAACAVARAWPRRFAVAIGTLVLAASVANLAMVPHPPWFSVIAVIAVPLAALLAGRLAQARMPDGLRTARVQAD